MAIKDTASAILKRMEEGTQAIYAGYREKARQANAAYQQKLSDLDLDYRENSRALTGTARAGLQDRLTSLSDLGLSASGAGEQARISAGTALLSALGKLSLQHTKEKAAAKTAYENTAASLEAEGEEKASQYRDTMTKLLLEQQNKDRDFAEKQAKNQASLTLQKQKLTLQQQKSAGKSAAASDGLTPDQKPGKMMDTIVKSARKYNKKGGYFYTDRDQVQKMVTKLLRDTSLSKTYRYQLYVQARAMGYFA